MCLTTICAVLFVLASCDVRRRNVKHEAAVPSRLSDVIHTSFSASNVSIVCILCLLTITCICLLISYSTLVTTHKTLTKNDATSDDLSKFSFPSVDQILYDFELKEKSLYVNKSVFKSWYFKFDSYSKLETNIQHVRPASFEKYFSEVLSLKNSPTHEVMKYEWARYETYKDFPVSSPAIPMRLSQAGFYYTGTEDETACFSCGMKHRNWRSGESPLVVHKSKSPECQFINGNDTTNVPIDNTKTPGNRTATGAVSETSQILPSGGAEGGPSDIQQNITSSSSVPVQNTKSPREFISSTIAQEHGRNSGTSNRFSVQEYNGNRHETNMPENHRSNRQYKDNTSNTEDLGINFERPKRPEFAVLAVRFSTFKGWPRSVQQQPRELADAGFYYAGYGDCVRCFHCGGGLRNWEYGDEPWTEHARWYPRCAHVRLCKGDEYIEQIQQELQEVEAASASEVPSTASTLEAAHSVNKDESVLERVSALSVIEMGYPENTVREAAEIFKRQKGNFQFTAQELMEIILDTEENVNTDEFRVPVPVVEELERTETEGRQSNPSNVISKTDTETGNLSSGEKEHKSQKEKVSHAVTLSTVSDARASLLDENRQLKEQMTCKICLDGEACVVFLPCSHMVACPQCAPALRKCPICRKLVRGTVRAYLS